MSQSLGPGPLVLAGLKWAGASAISLQLLGGAWAARGRPRELSPQTDASAPG